MKTMREYLNLFENSTAKIDYDSPEYDDAYNLYHDGAAPANKYQEQVFRDIKNHEYYQATENATVMKKIVGYYSLAIVNRRDAFDRQGNPSFDTPGLDVCDFKKRWQGNTNKNVQNCQGSR